MHRRHLFILGALLLLSCIILVSRIGVQAAPTVHLISAQSSPTPDPRLSIGNNVCLGCHGQPGPTLELANGDVLDLYVSPDEYAASVHGKSGYACVQCHREIGNYPHPPFQAEDLRDATLQLYQACQGCHQTQYELTQDSVHAAALNRGERGAAVCTDCHSAHTVQRLNEPGTRQMLPEARVWVPQTCSKCHSAIYNQYKDSVHGSALIGEGNPDVPTCIDCHNVHNIQDPTTAAFRLNSPQICAKCHTDEAKMAKYGISTQVLNTYVADFHGTTVMLFEKMTPDAETNKPVCYDCHGIHDIRRADDPEKGLQVRENLLKRCQVCHPNATTNFSAAWLSHYIPSPEKNPIVYYVNLFYKFFIPTVLGGMALLVALDLNKLARRRSRGLAATRVQEEIVREKSPLEGEALPAAEPDHLEASAVEPEVPNEEEQPVEIDSGTEQTPEPSEELTVDSEDEAQPGPPPDVNDPGIDQEANRE